ncbi:MAG: FAD-dependent oxidoreductase [Desulfobacterales bacterium]|nr:FAD-dependent oxidoreductase [Desulfobacterales bacterium]MCP4161544.1 FAD-dependent oxidoreductase [Deltaproteobacteria bacterium]
MQKKKVCIVGGGISGVVAAYTLTKKGHDVVVYERGRHIIYKDGERVDEYDDQAGGKCYTKFKNGQAFELGACSCGPNFKTVIKFARHTGTKLRKRLKFKVIKGSRVTSFRKIYWPFNKTFTILKEMAIYSFHAIKFAILYNRKTTYKPMSAEYQLPFTEFCQLKNLKIVPAWLDLPVTSFGYGEDIKTWYVLDYINLTNFMGMGLLLILLGIPPVRRIDKGYETLVDRIAERLNIIKHTEVINIERDSSVTVTVKNLTTGEETKDSFDDIIISVPMNEMVDKMELNSQESVVCDGIKHNPYTIIAGQGKNIPHECLLIKDNVHNTGHVALIEETMKAPFENFSVYYIPETGDDVSIDDTIDTLKSDLAVMNAELETVDTFKKWLYFPHFDTSDYFQKIEAIQGTNNTYWVGGMTKFELAERVATQAEALMDNSFDGNYPYEWFTTIRNLWYFYLESLPANK